MFSNSQTLEAVRTLRSLLPQLLPEHGTRSINAETLDLQLANLLNQADLEESIKVDLLLKVLDDIPETKAWLDHVLSDPDERLQEGLPGNPTLQPARKYICPEGNDYTWYHETTEEPPLCPTHLVKLVLA